MVLERKNNYVFYSRISFVKIKINKSAKKELLFLFMLDDWKL